MTTDSLILAPHARIRRPRTRRSTEVDDEPDCGTDAVPARSPEEAGAIRLGLAGAIVVCAGVPTAIVLSLWSNLNESFWYNEQWRAYYISLSGNWSAALKGDGAPFPAGWYFLNA